MLGDVVRLLNDAQAVSDIPARLQALTDAKVSPVPWSPHPLVFQIDGHSRSPCSPKRPAIAAPWSPKSTNNPSHPSPRHMLKWLAGLCLTNVM